MNEKLFFIAIGAALLILFKLICDFEGSVIGLVG